MDPQIDAKQIRDLLLGGMLAASPDLPFLVSRANLEALTQRFYAYEIPVDEVARIRACLFTMGRNHAVTSQRALHAKANRDLAVGRRLKEALEQADLTKTRMREFLAVVLAARDVKANQMMMLWHRCFELADAQEIEQLFPGTSQDQRDQWKRRGMLAIRSLCSPGLWEYMQFRGTDQGYRRVG